MENVESGLRNQIADQQNDIMSLRKELLQAEKTRVDSESENASLIEKIQFLEMEKEKVRQMFKVSICLYLQSKFYLSDQRRKSK